MIDLSNVESPCKLICEMDIEKGMCIGCGRTREEVARWLRYTPEQRREIMAGLEARLDKLKPGKSK